MEITINHKSKSRSFTVERVTTDRYGDPEDYPVFVVGDPASQSRLTFNFNCSHGKDFDSDGFVSVTTGDSRSREHGWSSDPHNFLRLPRGYEVSGWTSVHEHAGWKVCTTWKCVRDHSRGTWYRTTESNRGGLMNGEATAAMRADAEEIIALIARALIAAFPSVVLEAEKAKLKDELRRIERDRDDLRKQLTAKDAEARAVSSRLMTVSGSLERKAQTGE